VKGATQTITVSVPLAIRRRGGRKLVLAPEGPPTEATRARVDGTLVKALARAHRWKRMLESGRFSTVAELAAAEKMNESYICRVLRLTLLAPDIIVSILEGRQATETELSSLMQPIEVEWREQRCRILGAKSEPATARYPPPMSLSPLSNDAEQNRADHHDDAG